MRVIRVMVVVMVKIVSRRRCRIGGMAKRKLEEVPDLRFGVRLGFGYSHVWKKFNHAREEEGTSERERERSHFQASSFRNVVVYCIGRGLCLVF